MVSREILKHTKRLYPGCKCAKLDPPLEEGIYLEDLWMLESGCTGGSGHNPGWVCPRLDSIRRHYAQFGT